MAYALLVESLLRANQPQEAEKALREILSYDPGSLEARLSLADMQSRRGDTEAALETLRAAPEEVRERPALRRQYRLGALPERRSRRGPEAVAPLAAKGRRDRDNQRARPAQGADPHRPGAHRRGARPALQAAREPSRRTRPRHGRRQLQQRAGRRADAERTLNDLADVLAKDGKAKESREARLEAAQVSLDGKQWDQVERARCGPCSPRPTRRPTRPCFPGRRLGTGQALRRGPGPARQGARRPRLALAGRRAEILSRPAATPRPSSQLAALAAGDEVSALAAAQSYQRAEHYQESIPVLESWRRRIRTSWPSASCWARPTSARGSGTARWRSSAACSSSTPSSMPP